LPFSPFIARARGRGAGLGGDDDKTVLRVVGDDGAPYELRVG